MKVKLLRKIRKRFTWYLRESDGMAVLVDKKHKIIRVINESFMAIEDGYKTVEELREVCEVTMQERSFRVLKGLMLKPFGFKWSQYKASRTFWFHK